jgi:hypothetical protein
MKALTNDEIRRLEAFMASGFGEDLVTVLERQLEEVRVDFEIFSEEKDLQCNRGRALMLSELIKVLRDTKHAPQVSVRG